APQILIVSGSRSRHERLLSTSLWQPDAPQQVGISRICSQRIPPWLSFKKAQIQGSFRPGFFEPVHRLFVLAQPDMDRGKIKRRDVLALRLLLQFGETLQQYATIP